MLRLYFALLFTMCLTAGPAFADGKLGVCKRCVTESGIVANIWTRGDPSLGFCQGLNMSDGDRGDPLLCDAQAGVYRFGSMNDPFFPCGINSSNHGAWIGGENDDLVVLSPDPDDIGAGKLYRIEDGKGYRCGPDFVSGSNFSILKRGNYRDVVDLWVSDGSGSFRQETDRLQNGRYHALIAGQNYAAVLYGENKDILRIYGIRPNGTVDERANFINDGKQHTITKFSDTDFGITYGQNNDIRVRFCFNGQKWQTGYLGIKQPFAKSCNQDLTW